MAAREVVLIEDGAFKPTRRLPVETGVTSVTQSQRGGAGGPPASLLLEMDFECSDLHTAPADPSDESLLEIF